MQSIIFIMTCLSDALGIVMSVHTSLSALKALITILSVGACISESVRVMRGRKYGSVCKSRGSVSG